MTRNINFFSFVETKVAFSDLNFSIIILQVGAIVHRISANDPDIAPILRYRIDPNSSEARNEEGTLVRVQEYDYLATLDLNALDGLLQVARLLDRERVETIRLGLVVEDLAAVRGLQTASGSLLFQPD